ncbi:MAG: pyrimidine 5'-nucleotidase [Armatimonadetes bacterium]|nr:pyrimidine 5'-nucleotidase [Armatimonadota bacterium]
MSEYRCIEVILFDLDNTLYPPDAGLIEAGDRLIAGFIADRLDLPLDEADRLRVRLWLEYGATARGLQIEHGIPQREYFAGSIERVPIEDYIRPAPELAELLRALPQRRFVFTNSTEVYAERVLRALGVYDLFEGLYHIEFTGGSPKPEVESYRAVLEDLGVAPGRVALVDDTEANLGPAADLGMCTIKLHTPPEDRRHLHLADLRGLPELLT